MKIPPVQTNAPIGFLKTMILLRKNKKEKEKKLKLQWISISQEKTCFINQNLIVQEPDNASQSPVRAGGRCYRHAMRSQPLTTQVPAPFLMENPWPTSEQSTWSNATYLPQTSFEEWTFWTLSNPQACIPPCPGGYIKCCWSDNKSRVQQTCATRQAWNHSRESAAESTELGCTREACIHRHHTDKTAFSPMGHFALSLEAFLAGGINILGWGSEASWERNRWLRAVGSGVWSSFPKDQCLSTP